LNLIFRALSAFARAIPAIRRFNTNKIYQARFIREEANMLKLMKWTGAAGAAVFSALPAFAQEAAEAVAMPVAPVAAKVVEAAAPVADKGDSAFMMVCTVLVLLMIVPGLALFYGGLTRTKNMLSTMTQVTAAACFAMLLWVIYGYTMTFGSSSNEIISQFDKLFLAGVTAESTAATFSDGVVIPEFVFICFQMTFAAITIALVLGSVVERMKFSATMFFTLIWLTLVYFPVAHMVWYDGGDAGVSGYFFGLGALDFAGGTVVHINAGVSALVAALVLGKRIGFQKEIMAPHSLTLTFIGTGLLWVGWFGFNAGSALEANGSAALAMINTFVATASAALFWMLAERVGGHKASALGLCSGIIAGLVAVTPAAGIAGPFGAILLGAVASVACYYMVTFVKPKLGYDDSLDAFGIHGVGGIIGALGTGIVFAADFGGIGGDNSIGQQLGIQALAVGATIVWAAIGTLIALYVVKFTIGLRVTEEVEREGLDLGEHGERAYNY
jgi:ammonium transporter, Amt family